ncbi:uncharacterized protein LOC120134052 [Hibiscus syriacus]|uniref:uncharacterized protein LOC120134052 n=1 Tax=Hibiscus syriacus TaxID=106335 RepID=UPI001921593B|nr:uncharacterized protein LOC120134052 [Hibiscus syriacus]
MAPPPGPYSGSSTLALVARVSAFSFGLVYGSFKLKYLKGKAKSQRKAEAKAHHRSRGFLLKVGLRLV